MDELLRQALERRAQLRKELAAVDTFIRAYGGISDQRPAVEPDLFSSVQPTSSKSSRRTEVREAMDDAERIILAAGRPLSRSVLLKELQKAGHNIEGGDKSKVLGTNLWRSKRFHNLKGAGYWPLSKPIPDEFRRLPKRESMLLDEQG